MKKIGLIFTLVIVFIAICSTSHAGPWDWIKEFSKSVTSKSLSDTKIGSGLKEALRVGTERTIKQLSKDNGYYDSQAVKILLPEKVERVESMLRKIGLGPKIDEFILSMNRAAEKAAPVAADVFSTAITEMTIDDARSILGGSETAVTDYFKDKTYNKLLQVFQPVINRAMSDYAVRRKFDEILGGVSSIPFGNIDLTQYVASKALNGLFYTLGQEEKKIRQDPAARATNLLKQVFKD